MVLGFVQLADDGDTSVPGYSVRAPRHWWLDEPQAPGLILRRAAHYGPPAATAPRHHHGDPFLRKPRGLAPLYQLECTKEGALGGLTVHVECLEEASASEQDRTRTGRELARHVKSYIGINVDVKVHNPGAIERSAGKAKRLVTAQKT